MTRLCSHLTSSFYPILLLLYYQYGIAICSQQPQQIVVYKDYMHQGDRESVNFTKCSNLSQTMAAQVTAVDTKSKCVRLYAGNNCTGKSIEMMSRSPSHHNLWDWNFNDVTRSVGVCRDKCNVNVTGPLPPKEGVNVRIYDRTSYQGATQMITVKGCAIIPRKFNYHVISVNTSGENCFELYNNIECKSAGSGKEYDSIELRKGTPFHDDLRRWVLSPIKAISHCSFKCSQNHSQNATSVQPENGKQVILYDDPKFAGNLLRVNLSEDKHTSCINLDQFNGWEGATNSIKLHKNDSSSCVVLYATLNCSGDHFRIKVNSSLEDLSAKNFSALTRSIQLCGEEELVGSTEAYKSVRWTTVLAVVVGLIVGAMLLLLVVGKWWYPDMRIGGVFQICRRNQLGSNGDWSALRL